jgi:hypothetical protein
MGPHKSIYRRAGNKRSGDSLKGKHRKGFMFFTDPKLLPRPDIVPIQKKRKHDDDAQELDQTPAEPGNNAEPRLMLRLKLKRRRKTLRVKKS